MTYEEKMADLAERVSDAAKYLQDGYAAAPLLGGVDLSDVSYINIWRDKWNGERLRINLDLNSEKKDSTLAHRLIQKLSPGVPFVKSKGWNGESLILTLTTDEYEITISGAVPKTCQVVMTEVDLTAEEIEAAREAALAKVPTKRITREIRCTEHETAVA